MATVKTFASSRSRGRRLRRAYHLSRPDHQPRESDLLGPGGAPVGSYNVSVYATGTKTNPVIGPASFNFADGKSYFVCAFGSMTGKTLTVVQKCEAVRSPTNPAGVATKVAVPAGFSPYRRHFGRK